jgi:hypothetical protein
LNASLSLFALGFAFSAGCGSGCCCGFRVLGSLFGGKGFGSGDLFSFASFAGGQGSFAFASFDLAGTSVGRFENTSRLTATITQIVELGATKSCAR